MHAAGRPVPRRLNSPGQKICADHVEAVAAALKRVYLESLQAMARQGGIATRKWYGNEFFRQIRQKRQHYLKGYLTQRTKDRLRQEAVDQAKKEPNWAIAELWKAVARSWER